MSRIVTVLLALCSIAAAGVDKPAPPPDLHTPPADAVTAGSGLVTKVLAPGSGTAHPAATDFVHIRYAVWKASNEKLIDSSFNNLPTFVELSKLLTGMREAILSMTPGEKLRAWVPSTLGDKKIAEGDTYVIDLELIDVVPPPATPPDVAAPPADATVTKSGLAYKILRAGTGTEHPRKSSTVVVNYSGWTTDGRMFDSSVVTGEPSTFPLTAVIPGWREGLQLMTPGELVRFWIPSNLAYGDQKGMPHGMLVFDVELVKVK
jgi:FKBP-type peptidyl-prolyl cis-trans isomerase